MGFVVVGGEVEPAVRHVVAGEEGLDVVAALRPAMADHAEPFGVDVRVLPVAQQLVEDGVEMLVRRIPGLEEVVVETDVVDRADRHLGVGVRGEEDELGVGCLHLGLLEEIRPRHRRHALVGHDEGNRSLAEGELREHGERFGARSAPDDLVLGAVLPPQITGDRLRDGPIVVDRHDYRLRHPIAPRQRLAGAYLRTGVSERGSTPFVDAGWVVDRRSATDAGTRRRGGRCLRRSCGRRRRARRRATWRASRGSAASCCRSAGSHLRT